MNNRTLSCLRYPVTLLVVLLLAAGCGDEGSVIASGTGTGGAADATGLGDGLAGDSSPGADMAGGATDAVVGEDADATTAADTPQGDAQATDSEPGDTAQGQDIQADASQSDAPQADATQDDAGQGDADQGDAGPGDAGQGDAGQGDTAQGDTEQSDAASADSEQPDAAQDSAPTDGAPTDGAAGDAEPGDAGPTDAAGTDAEPGDGAAVDAGAADAGATDAGATDAAQTDAQADGQPADGSAADAGSADAAAGDTSQPDAGCTADAQCPAATQPCLVAVCKLGVCGTAPAADGGACDDGDLCTTGDACKAGACAAGTAVTCSNDGNVCVAASCDKATGKCATAPAAGACNDGNACTDKDTCAAGKCAGSPATCNDGNPCTDDACDAAKGCTAANNTAVCGDGDKCAKPGACKDGACVGVVKTVCDDGNPCTVDSCNPASGTCEFAGSATGPCDDGNACTDGDTCKQGLCKAGGPKVCDDSNPCTDDSCAPAKGCVNAPNAAKCDDGNACTDSDVCKAGTCAGAAISCDDGNPCTDDQCDKLKGGCVFSANAKPCAPDACSTGTCNQGKCGTPVAKNCDDNNPCTKDSCDLTKGCANATVTDGTACGTGDKCATAPLCKAGQCQPGTQANCDDGNACTADSCDPLLGCTWKGLAGACDDGNACTVGEACGVVPGKGIQCTGGTPLDVNTVCDDKNVCTNEACDPKLGCTHAANSLPCDDANPCTDKDVCAASKCVGGPSAKCDDGNSCTLDQCDPGSGNCSWTVDPKGVCSDGDACTTGDACQGLKCVGTATVCDDKNPCTVDSCDKASGKCVATAGNDAAACDDANPCTTGDACKAGACVGAAVSCDDANTCTDDVCDKGTGKCVFTPNVAPCTTADKCAATGKCDGKGACASVPGNKCDDKNPCTVDSCDANTGNCSYANAADGGACDDGVTCTSDSVCTAGKCQTKAGCLLFGDTFATCLTPVQSNWVIEVPAPSPGGLPRAVKWAVDGLPLTGAGLVDHGCTLNFNNNINYCDAIPGQNGMCQVPLGTATQPVAADFSLSGGLMPTLIFDTYYDVDTFVAGGDQPRVDIIDTANQTVLLTTLLPVTAADLKVWKDGYKIQVPAAMGKKVVARFSLNQPANTTQSQGNTGAGFFVDNLKFSALATAEICTDGLDNDGNFKVDCADPACTANPVCIESACGDGVDNDKDGATDCKDSECAADIMCTGTTLLSNVFECSDKSFTFVQSNLPISWAVDATPAAVKPPTGTCSLNYNNGTNYNNGGGNAGTAQLAASVNAAGLKQVFVALWFYLDTESLAGGYTQYDRVYVSASTDDFAGCGAANAVATYDANNCNTTNTMTVVLSHTVVQKWLWTSMDFSKMGGKSFKLRIKFDSLDGINNDTAGPFIDDLKIVGK